MSPKIDLPDHVDTLDEIADWYPRQDFCGSEDFSRIYSGYNLSSSAAAKEAFQRLGHSRGFQFFVDWTRSMAGYCALGTGSTPGNNFDWAKLAASIAPNRPQLVVSDPKLGPNPMTKGAPAFVIPGDRSFAHNGLGWLTASNLCSLPHLVLGDVKKFLSCQATSEVFRALDEVGADIRFCSPEESELARRAMHNDVDALVQIAREWLPKSPWPRDRFLIVRTTVGEEGIRLYGTEAPTAQADYISHRTADGQQRVLVANDGFREDWIMSTAVEVGPGFAWYRAYTDNPSEKGAQREIRIDGIGGQVLFAFEFGGDEPPRFLVPDIPFEVAPPPSGTPPPTNDHPAPKPKKSNRTALYAGAALLALALILFLTC